METRETESTVFLFQYVLAGQKLVIVVLAELLGLAVVRNHLFEKRKKSP